MQAQALFEERARHANLMRKSAHGSTADPRPGVFMVELVSMKPPNLIVGLPLRVPAETS
jgi:hypothetical protein